MPLILRVIAWLIGFYRRWLSGRGPLRGVRCSFAPDESCSAFGLRATREAPSARIAVGRIVRRLRRCREACVLTDGRVLSWAEIHDREPDELVRAMQADGERGPAIAQMLAARLLVAGWRGERRAIEELRRTRVPRPRLVAHPAVARRARERFSMLATVTALALVTVVVQPWIGSTVLALLVTATTLSAWRTLSLERRFAMHARYGRISTGSTVTAGSGST